MGYARREKGGWGAFVKRLFGVWCAYGIRPDSVVTPLRRAGGWAASADLPSLRAQF